MTMLNERNRAVLLAVTPKPFEEKPIKPCAPAHKRYKTETDAMVAWEQMKSECVLLKGEK
jgi:hypothetical protein